MKTFMDPSHEWKEVLADELAEIRRIRELRRTRGLDVREGKARTPAVKSADIAALAVGGANAATVDRTETKSAALEPGAAQTSTLAQIFPDWVKAVTDAHAANLTGLCFSGGGIRSATFNLGVLQALAELKLLHRFDYLSTVSGGGYIGSWLAAWIGRRKSFGEVERRLGNSRVEQKENKEPQEIRFLRTFSNYLTPKLGFFSGDTWAMVAIYTRNMLLNLIVVLAALATAMIFPRAFERCLKLWMNGAIWTPAWIAVALALIGGACWVTFINMGFLEKNPPIRSMWWTQPPVVFFCVCAPLAVVAIEGALWPWRTKDVLTPLGWAWRAAATFGGVWLLAAIVSYVVDSRPKTASPSADADKWKQLKGLVVAVISAVVAGFVSGVMYGYLARWLAGWYTGPLLSFGVPLTIAILLLCGTLHIGLMGVAFPEAKREWWGRAGGSLLLVALCWLVFAMMALMFPDFVRYHHWQPMLEKIISWKILTPAWVLTTISSVIAGKSTATGTPGSLNARDLIAKIGPYVFIFGLLCWISWVADKALVGHERYFVFILFATCTAVAVGMSLRVDINQFSMHMFYRNRIVRCYLGASNENRQPNRYTGFCQADDVALKSLRASGGYDYDGPYPVLNASLNLVQGKDLAWQERKAESFVMSPLYCGYDVWVEQQDSPMTARSRENPGSPTSVPMKKALDPFGFRPTDRYAFPPPGDGPRLGLAMAISGAAASPNMGFYTSAPVAFLMTVFDVRLGQWLGNPRNKKAWTTPTPFWGLTYLLAELLGMTNDNASYVYLSDGGHFENMALYEMVKRRCGLVIVCDAEADGLYQFAGLGNAIRKCRIDLGVDVQLDISAIVPDEKTGFSGSHCAVGTIHYENADSGAPSGTIIYVKASLVGDEPTDVKNYSKECSAFPHESTVDQWFSETQFESYRALGYHTITSSFRTPATVIGAETSAAAAPTCRDVPGPGSIPRDPADWRRAALEAEKPVYQRVQEALRDFGFDVEVLGRARVVMD